jgi:hypothetical protein
MSSSGRLSAEMMMMKMVLIVKMVVFIHYLESVTSEYEYPKKILYIDLDRSLTCWINIILQNWSIMKIASYFSTVKDFFHLQTILSYISIPGNMRGVVNGSNPTTVTHTPCHLCSQDLQWYSSGTHTEFSLIIKK